MFSERKFALILYGGIATMALVATPYEIVSGEQFLKLHLHTALAKDGNNGGGRGAGNAGGNGNGGGRGQGNAGDNGNGAGGGQGNTNSAEGASKEGRTGRDNNGSVESKGSLEVRHPDGMSEKIQNGRYVMKDARGRTIINRSANSSDRSRLRSFIH